MNVFIIISGFCTVVGFLFLVVRVLHPTRAEFEETMKKQREDYFKLFQSKESCTLFHETQDVRNNSFTNSLIDIKDEIKELRKDIKEAVTKFLDRR